MEKEFIPYTEALALKELGFDEPYLAFYRKSTCNLFITDGYLFNDLEDKHFVKAPLYQQCWRWFREKFKHLKFFVKEEDFREGLYEYDIKDVLCVSGFKSYEEAELECLMKLIEIVKEK
jgi:hypothetical protein